MELNRNAGGFVSLYEETIKIMIEVIQIFDGPSIGDDAQVLVLLARV